MSATSPEPGVFTIAALAVATHGPYRPLHYRLRAVGARAQRPREAVVGPARCHCWTQLASEAGSPAECAAWLAKECCSCRATSAHRGRGSWLDSGVDAALAQVLP